MHAPEASSGQAKMEQLLLKKYLQLNPLMQHSTKACPLISSLGIYSKYKYNLDLNLDFDYLYELFKY